MTTTETGTSALSMTTEAEVGTVREVLVEAGLLTETVRYAFFAPEEPPKDEVLAGAPADRRFRVVLLDLATGRSWDTVVSTDSHSVVSSRQIDPPREGQPPILDTEFEIVEDILNADQRWLDALAHAGIEPDVGAGGAAVGRRLRLPRRGRAPDRARPSGSARTTSRTTRGRTRSTGWSPTSTSPPAPWTG